MLVNTQLAAIKNQKYILPTNNNFNNNNTGSNLNNQNDNDTIKPMAPETQIDHTTQCGTERQKPVT